MAEPFEARTSTGEGLLGRVTGRRPQAAALRELEGLLASADCVGEVTPDGVRAVAARHGVDLETKCRTPRRNLYRRFLEHCLLDFCLTDQELEELEHLRELLCLEKEDAAAVQDQVAREVYGAAVEEVLRDYRLDDEEAAFLRRLREDLELPEFHASRLYEEEALRSQQRLLSRTAVDSAFLAPQSAAIELEGASKLGIEEAIQAVVDETAHALPRLSWAELTELRVRVESGRAVEWRVKLKAGLQEAGPPPS